ncbi:probable serine/threonine-protein kinase clkA [Condylostylus longicornis]|uniref:probable serine/threonine-protein kinase clkA n=1 Tax=Condylostylus longicornis TaxID=2530218 RepID=UPI00244E31B6|nr:probable serine/threonine-protein kinase clkA [Condylostylus longicornis]
MKPYSILVLITVFTFSNCIPTSVLADTKDPTDQKNFKVKRSSNEKPIPLQHENTENNKNLNVINDGTQTYSSATTTTLTNNNQNIKGSSQLSNQNNNDKLHITKNDNELNNNIPDQFVSGLFMATNLIKEKPIPHKRGVNSQFLYGSNNNNNPNNDNIQIPSTLTRNYPNYIPNGIWANELDPMTSMDFQDFDDYPQTRSQYISHNKPYDNLQNILNSEPSITQYQNPMALSYSPYSTSSYGYNNRYYNERRKRSYKQHSSFDDTVPEYTELELTPNELLALLAMIEAGALEKEPQSDSLWELNNKDYLTYSKPNYYDDHDEIGSLITPNKLDENDFDPRYQIPVNFENIPRYEIYKDKGARNPSKRFMVSKKKRSLGHLNYFNGPIGKPGLSFSPMKGAKSIQKVI